MWLRVLVTLILILFQLTVHRSVFQRNAMQSSGAV